MVVSDFTSLFLLILNKLVVSPLFINLMYLFIVLYTIYIFIKLLHV